MTPAFGVVVKSFWFSAVSVLNCSRLFNIRPLFALELRFEFEERLADDGGSFDKGDEDVVVDGEEAEDEQFEELWGFDVDADVDEEEEEAAAAAAAAATADEDNMLE